jgi:hypothetical protein
LVLLVLLVVQQVITALLLLHFGAMVVKVEALVEQQQAHK